MQNQREVEPAYIKEGQELIDNFQTRQWTYARPVLEAIQKTEKYIVKVVRMLIESEKLNKDLIIQVQEQKKLIDDLNKEVEANKRDDKQVKKMEPKVEKILNKDK